MRWPFVSRAAHFELQSKYQAMHEQMLTWRAHYVAEKARADKQAEYNRTLVTTVVEMRRDHGFTPASVHAAERPTSPLAQLGPLTQAALREMSVGQSGTVRRKMEAEALRLHTAEKMTDAQLATRVHSGESPRLNGARPRGD